MRKRGEAREGSIRWRGVGRLRSRWRRRGVLPEYGVRRRWYNGWAGSYQYHLDAFFFAHMLLAFFLLFSLDEGVVSLGTCSLLCVGLHVAVASFSLFLLLFFPFPFPFPFPLAIERHLDATEESCIQLLSTMQSMGLNPRLRPRRILLCDFARTTATSRKAPLYGEVT